jgi:F-type H+-transporting ATPase subunit b
MLFGFILAQIKTMKILFCLILLFACSVAIAEETQPAAEQGIFNGTVADALWTVIAFTALVILLKKFAWKPILANLQERHDHIAHQIQAAQDTRQQAEKLLDDHKQKGFQIVNDATDQAQLRTQQLLDKAQQQAIELKRKSDEDISNARAAFSEHIWKQSSDVILALSSKILEKTVTKEDNERLINETIEKLRQENPK